MTWNRNHHLGVSWKLWKTILGLSKIELRNQFMKFNKRVEETIDL